MAPRAGSSPRTRRTSQRLFGGRRTPAPYVKDAFHELRRPRARGRREPGGRRHEGRGASTCVEVPAGGQVDAARCASARAERPSAVRPDVRARCSSARRARGRRVLRGPLPRPPRRTTRRGSLRQAYAGLLWSKQFYHYVVERLARRRSRPAAAARRAPRRAQRRVAAPLQPRRHLDARQVGVPLVRGVGPRLPHDRRSRAIDPQFAKEQLAAVPARVVHAPERADPGLRVRVRRRQPARARLGVLARLQDDRARAASATASSSRASSRSCCSTSPGGSTARTPTGNNLFAGGFLGLDNIGVFDRCAAAADRRPARAGRRHGVDGVLLRARCSRWRSSSRATTRPTRTWRRSSSSTSSPSPTR